MYKLTRHSIGFFTALLSISPAVSSDYSMSVGFSHYDYGLKITTSEVSDFSFDGRQYEVSLQRATEDYTLSVKHTFSQPVDIAPAEEHLASPYGEALYMSQEETSISIQRPISERLNWFAGYYEAQLDGKGHNDGTDGTYYNISHSWLKSSGAFIGLAAQRPLNDKLVLFGRGAFQIVSADVALANDQQINPNVSYQTAIRSSAYGIEGSASLFGFGIAYPLKTGSAIILSYERKDFDFEDFNLNTTRSSVDAEWETIGLSISFGL